ncbi:MAG: GLUG motif-containing protein, partial [Planctomycetota bacterium]
QSRIQNCFSKATVTGNQTVGGLIGHSGAMVTGCYSAGSITGKGDYSWAIGGLIGNNGGNGDVKNCYSTGSVVGEGARGLMGSNDGTVLASFWDIETSGQTTSYGGVGLTTSEMQMAITFLCWGYEPLWTIDEGLDYPRLVWENKPGELMMILT